jgi:hypothetical protein
MRVGYIISVIAARYSGKNGTGINCAGSQQKKVWQMIRQLLKGEFVIKLDAVGGGRSVHGCMYDVYAFLIVQIVMD